MGAAEKRRAFCAPLWLICGLFALPCILVSVFLLRRKVNETMGVDYEAISEESV